MTRLLRDAEESGAAIVPGLEMFIRQAYAQYEGFTGLPGKKVISPFKYFAPSSEPFVLLFIPAPKERIRKILAGN